MPWTGRIGDGGVEVDRLGGQVDYRSAGDAKGIDIAASERGTRDGLADERVQIWLPVIASRA